MKRFLLPAVPFAYSWVLSLATVGDTVYWQDSGLYLTAVREMSVLYPPGFVLYQLLCKAWTQLLFFVDFTLAVHLFSSCCAALSSAVMALAARDLLRAQGRFRVLAEPADDRTALAGGMLSGILLAGGYTFWFTGIYAKGYALYYLLLTLILWRMIRADETGKGRDLTWVAALIGLAWAAHPSAVLLGPAFLLFAFSQRRRMGPGGIVLRTAISALLALGPALVLPYLASRSSLEDLGSPTTLSSWKEYLFGSKFTSMPHAFGWQESRLESFGRYLWEEFLVAGLVLVVLGLLRTARGNRPLFGAILLWLVPYSAFTILFKIEGQHDCWFVAAWLPLYLAGAVGVAEVLAKFRHRTVPFALGGVSALIAVLVNGPAVNQKQYSLAEAYGRIYLQNLDPGAVLILFGDDTLGATRYLQSVRGYRTDVVIVPAPLLFSALTGKEAWYLERLLARHPFLRPASLPVLPQGLSLTDQVELGAAAFLNANGGCGRPVFSALRPPQDTLASGLAMVPAGPVWKLEPAGDLRADPRYWKALPFDEKEVRSRFRRQRGQAVTMTASELTVRPECYEERLFQALLNAKRNLAEWHFEHASWTVAAKLFESILESEPEPARRTVIAYYLGVAAYSAEEDARAEGALREALAGDPAPWVRGGALYHLGMALRRVGRTAEAAECFRKALEVPGLDPPLLEEIRRESRRP